MKRLGLDIGSTTIKCVVVNEKDEILFSAYKRHLSRISEMIEELLREIAGSTGEDEMRITISGSAGIGLAEKLDIPFVQEVYSTRTAVRKLFPDTDAVIELGGEDAKILFLTNGFETRMNGTCAGGTGAFIDQMATLLHISADELNRLSEQHSKIYTIASRCGVFAKSDIQQLINQGVELENVAASIFKAVSNQTIGGLAQGRKIEGNILYLGGPFNFFPELRRSFDETLGLHGICPENALLFVALGAVYSNTGETFSLNGLAGRIKETLSDKTYLSCEPLFKSKEDYEAFLERQRSYSSVIGYISEPTGRMFLGIDAGSTTIKAVLCNSDGAILDRMYRSNQGNPIPVIKEYLLEIYRKYPEIEITASAVTGYGEDIIKNAFGVDFGIVETIAHYTAAKKFKPDVDFIIDIGGQDIKCFKIHNNAIDNIFLNEACSSGCGSFLQTFAETLGYNIESFAKLGLYADKPVELGSRCTVFMNSSVKQAQKDGASLESISAGLSISVVKNALYKVIRCSSVNQLGKNIVVQGGTFLNDGVLRAFEQEIKQEVVRPEIAGIMGAYGAALYACEKSDRITRSSLIGRDALEGFSHKVQAVLCNGCSNHCQLTVNTFTNTDADGKTNVVKEKYIAGNRCDKPLNLRTQRTKYNLYKYKRTLLDKYRTNEREAGKITIGIPMVLNMYELLPFWHTFFKQLGFNVIVSPDSTHELYVSGQHTIPSDTICFPAKVVHGHIEALLREDPDALFYPCMSYNVDEEKGDNHYNCPVVAYYPEVIGANVKAVKNITFIKDFVGLHIKKGLYKKLTEILNKYFDSGFNIKDVKKAADMAYDEYDRHVNSIRNKAAEYLETAKNEHKPVIVIAGRPYHIDPEINHGIDSLICDLGAVVISEDGISQETERFRTTVLNQWTNSSRLYCAAKYTALHRGEPNINLVQFVSFGCGIDAITTDEVRSIIENEGKIYTQIKIDEVANTGAAKIRIRSLFAATGTEDGEKDGN